MTGGVGATSAAALLGSTCCSVWPHLLVVSSRGVSAHFACCARRHRFGWDVTLLVGAALSSLFPQSRWIGRAAMGHTIRNGRSVQGVRGCTTPTRVRGFLARYMILTSSSNCRSHMSNTGG